MIALIDMQMGNLRSVQQALHHIGAIATVTTRAEMIHDADAVILPGVGAFGDGMRALERQALVHPLRCFARKGGRLLGICLGMHLLAEEGLEHGLCGGLGLVPGRAERLTGPPGLRVPNTGWRTVRVRADAPLLAPADGESFYFAHAYHLVGVPPECVAATIKYGTTVVAAVQRGNVVGLQFHPEKSQDTGLDCLHRFVTSTAASALSP